MLFGEAPCLLSRNDSLTCCSPLLLFCHTGGLMFFKKFLDHFWRHVGEYAFLQSRGGLWFRGKEPHLQCRRQRTFGFDPWVRKIPWRRITPVFLWRKFRGQKGPVGYSPWGSKRIGQDWAWMGQRSFWSCLLRLNVVIISCKLCLFWSN